MLRKLRNLESNIRGSLRIPGVLEKIHANLVNEAMESLKGDPRYRDRRNLIPYGHKVYSQNEEDGIIREIFRRIGVTNKAFVEFGVGTGLENNTLALLFDGWRGLWIESSAKSTRQIRDNFRNAIGIGALTVINSWVTEDNIDGLISSVVDQDEIDLLSIDIDGNDFHVFNSITCVKPRVVVIEYNAKFPPPTVFCMHYDETYAWKGDDCFGASLKFLEIEFEKKGYCLVGCNLTGANAFFVRRELVGDRFLEPHTAENHYQPARYYLSPLASGHAPSYATLEESLARTFAAPDSG